jgi:hypothetical protein
MRSGRLLLVAAAVGVSAITDAPSALAEPVATCTSDVIDGVEVDYCVATPTRTPSLMCLASTWTSSSASE